MPSRRAVSCCVLAIFRHHKAHSPHCICAPTVAHKLPGVGDMNLRIVVVAPDLAVVYIVAGLAPQRIRPILDVAMARFAHEQSPSV